MSDMLKSHVGSKYALPVVRQREVRSDSESNKVRVLWAATGEWWQGGYRCLIRRLAPHCKAQAYTAINVRGQEGPVMNTKAIITGSGQFVPGTIE